MLEIDRVEIKPIVKSGTKYGKVIVVLENGERVPYIGKDRHYEYQREQAVAIAARHNAPFLEVDPQK